MGDGEPDDVATGPPDMADLLADLAAVERAVDDPEEQRRVREAMETARNVETGVFGRVVTGFDRHDLVEAGVASVLVGVPMAVEGGTQEVGDFVATHPAYLATTLTATVALVVGVLYVAQIQDVRVSRPLLGLVPRRVVGVLGAAAVAAALVMTVWGRVDWADPWLAVCRVAVAFAPMAVFGALGDILPGS